MNMIYYIFLNMGFIIGTWYLVRFVIIRFLKQVFNYEIEERLRLQLWYASQVFLMVICNITILANHDENVKILRGGRNFGPYWDTMLTQYPGTWTSAMRVEVVLASMYAIRVLNLDFKSWFTVLSMIRDIVLCVVTLICFNYNYYGLIYFIATDINMYIVGGIVRSIFNKIFQPSDLSECFKLLTFTGLLAIRIGTHFLMIPETIMKTPKGRGLFSKQRTLASILYLVIYIMELLHILATIVKKVISRWEDTFPQGVFGQGRRIVGQEQQRAIRQEPPRQIQISRSKKRK